MWAIRIGDAKPHEETGRKSSLEKGRVFTFEGPAKTINETISFRAGVLARGSLKPGDAKREKRHSGVDCPSKIF